MKYFFGIAVAVGFIVGFAMLHLPYGWLAGIVGAMLTVAKMK